MVVLTPPPPTLSSDNLTLYYVVDELLARSPILVFYGPSATATSNANSSRIQAHIFSPGGFQSYPRLTISPSSPLYAAINCLPRDEQGDEICRGLTFSVYKYFAELPDAVRNVWEQQPTALGKQPNSPKPFSDAHAAILASRMTRVENVADVIKTVRQALGEQTLSWLDIDVVLPPGSMREVDTSGRDSMEQSDEDYARQRYGEYAAIVKLFGEPAFLPTSRLRRAPSKPSGLNRDANFSRNQKESLRREMCELLDTEESYVSKLHDLLYSVAADFRQKSRDKSPESTSPSSQALESLFPPSLDKILKMNSGFLEAMRKVLDESEDGAIQDIEATTADASPTPLTKGSKPDVTGAAELADCLLTWLPRFADCYADYIQAHVMFPHYLKTFLTETGSSFSRRIQDTGEQRLMSMLIEPVQRLPRYNLYIDNIIKQLPARHSAIKQFLKARDIITEICSRDEAPLSPTKVAETLQQVVSDWPSDLVPAGRLIMATDVMMLKAPYRIDTQDSPAALGILLLFSDCVVFLKRKSKQSMNARTLLGQLDGTAVSLVDPNAAKELDYHQHMRLSDVDFSELQGGSTVQFLNVPQSGQKPSGPRRPGSRPVETALQICRLTGPYENRAARLSEEIVKARVESRFSEAERESHKWEVRSIGTTDVHLFTSLFEDASGQATVGRGAPAKIRVIVDEHRGLTKDIKPGQDGVSMVVKLTIQGQDFYRLDTSVAGETSHKDNVYATELLAVLGKRTNNFLQSRSSNRNPNLAPILVARNQLILQSLNIVPEKDGAASTTSAKESYRAPSPVKMLSNFFGGSVQNTPSKHHRPALSMNDVPRLTPFNESDVQANSLSSLRPKSTVDLRADANESSALNQILNSYLLALSARKGNIVGRVLRSRAHSASEIAVNELYNTLLEDNAACQAAAQAPVDVLFAAFEKFVKVAWKLHHGQILTVDSCGIILSGASETNENFKAHLAAMSKPNQVALKVIVTLLSSLLEGTSSDGDRGILTAAFAEVLTPEGLRNPNEVIMVLDRFVGDFDSLLATAGVSSDPVSQKKGSINSENRTSRLMTGVVDVMAGLGAPTGGLSNHSSLRKKFGFGSLHRKNSKAEDSEGSSSVWRTLSKSRSNTLQAALALDSEKPSLHRSRSQDEREKTSPSPKRPVSRDHPTLMGTFGLDPDRRELSTIGENVAANGTPKKKRRSSLSDLVDLRNSPAANKLDFQLPQSPRLPSPLRPGSPSKVSGIPQRSPAMRSNTRKENVAPSTLPRMTSPLSPTVTTTVTASVTNRASPTRTVATRPTGPRTNTTRSSDNAIASADSVTITSHIPAPIKRRAGPVHTAALSSSGIPSLRSPTYSPGALHERPNVTNITRFPPPMTDAMKASTPISTPRRLRMQSPQKLRERLAVEARAVQDAESAMTEEMVKIGEELHALGSGAGAGSTYLSDPRFRALEARLKVLESSIPSGFASLSKRITAMDADLSSGLVVSEAMAKKLDELLRDANAENEALYGRFNEELAKLTRNVRTPGAEEMRRQVRGAVEEQERLRKENARMRREIAGLRAQLRE